MGKLAGRFSSGEILVSPVGDRPFPLVGREVLTLGRGALEARLLARPEAGEDETYVERINQAITVEVR